MAASGVTTAFDKIYGSYKNVVILFLIDLSLPLVILFSTTQIKPLWIAGRLYCDFLEMCLVLWWRLFCKHHWYDLPFLANDLPQKHTFCVYLRGSVFSLL